MLEDWHWSKRGALKYTYGVEKLCHLAKYHDGTKNEVGKKKRRFTHFIRILKD